MFQVQVLEMKVPSTYHRIVAPLIWGRAPNFLNSESLQTTMLSQFQFHFPSVSPVNPDITPIWSPHRASLNPAYTPFHLQYALRFVSGPASLPLSARVLYQ